MKAWILRRLALPTAILTVLSLAACSGGSSTTAPSTTPSPIPSTASSGISQSTSTITGTVSTDANSGVLSASQSRTLDVSGLTITVVGTGITSSVASDGSFTIQVPSGSVTLQFSGPGVDASLTIDGLQSGEVRHINVHVSGENADIEDGNEADNNDQEIEGLITAIDALNLTITVNGQVINVPEGTPIVHDCLDFLFTDLAVGDRVHVKATSSASGLTADEVTLQNGEATHGVDSSCDGDQEGDETDDVELKGVVVNLSNACPSLTFSLEGDPTIIMTDASTEFDHITCDELADGDTVDVEGIAQPDGSVMAKKVEADDDSNAQDGNQSENDDQGEHDNQSGHGDHED